MRVGLFVAHESSLPSGHRTYQETLLHGLLGQSRHQVVVLSSERDPLPEVPAPHELVRIRHPNQSFVAALNFDLHAEGVATLAARRAGVEALIGNVQWGMPRPPGVARIGVLYEAAFLEPTRWGVYPTYSYRQLLTVPRRNLRGADAVVCLSEHGRDQIAEGFGVPRDRIVVAPPAFKPFGQPVLRDWSKPERFVLMVGWFHPRKDLPLALAGWRAALEAGMDADLVLAGTEGPPDRVHGGIGRRVLEGVGRELAARVHFTGSIPRAELGELYRRCSAVVMTSMHEGFGIPAVEAFSVGKPVVAVARASLPEVVGPVGTLVAPQAGAIGEALSAVVANPPDPAVLKRYAAGFTLERQVGPVLETLDRLASARAARPTPARAGALSDSTHDR